MWPMYWNSEPPSTPITATTPSGMSVTVMTTTRMVPDMGIQNSSGAPTAASSSTASTAFRVSTMPPKSFPESV